ncbi:MAG: FABP family protein [Acidipropionibacterium acidipropionici]|nr:FABP family protein [Acidipropionibacterium acidipropionici]
MPFQIPDNLDNNLMPLAWMIGHWEGDGHGVGPDGGEISYGCQVDFTDNGGDYLHYICQTFTKNSDGTPKEPLWMETGFWRPRLDKTIDVVMAAPEGWAELWTGTIDGAKIELVTDAVARSKDATVPYTGGQRLYGQVEGDLMWAYDRATTETPLAPHMWARLRRA